MTKKKKKPARARLLNDIKFDADWANKHMESVRPAIKELDRQTMEAIAKAPFIVVTNETK